jgi:flagellar biosynthetic protein FliR
MLRDLAIGYALTLGLVVARIAAFVLTSPFPGQGVPRTQRVALVFALAMAAMAHREPFPKVFDPFAFGPLVLGEMAVGALIGFVFRLALAAADVAGELASQALGLGSATLFNPALGAQETALARVFSTFALALALALGAHRVVIQILLGSFDALPVGAGVSPSLAGPVLADMVGAALALGLRVALPVVAVSLVIQAALALVARVAPSLQIFNVGFAVLIGAGLLVLSASMREMLRPLLDHVGSLPVRIDRVLTEIAP